MNFETWWKEIGQFLRYGEDSWEVRNIAEKSFSVGYNSGRCDEESRHYNSDDNSSAGMGF
jgi:hypothetical protein